MIHLRSIAFNITFYGFTFFFCLLGLPSLLLARAQYFKILMWYFRSVYWIEKHILGLDFEVRGAEHLPKDGQYIVAAKHYSAYETLKIHILFPDPAVIMKRELRSIPLWGWHAQKSDMIFIDRGSRDVAMRSIIEGALRMKSLNRPIIIFPQGTRVGLEDTIQNRPYKIGIMKMYEATNLPIIPLAMNSGFYWGKDQFLKRSGKVIFEFLPPIAAGKDSNEAFALMRDEIESVSQKLVNEAIEANR
jgi:1-acyl-sn-glycerol-3-phosphate acyltransferase